MKEKFWTCLSAKLLFPPTSSHCFTIFQKLGWAQLRLGKEKSCQKYHTAIISPTLSLSVFPLPLPIDKSLSFFPPCLALERKHYKVTTTALTWGTQPRVLWPSKIITAICLFVVLEEKQAHAFAKKNETQKPWKSDNGHQDQQSERILTESFSHSTGISDEPGELKALPLLPSKEN